MASPKFDRERASQILIDAALLGDEAAMKRHGVTVRTLQRYRLRLADDEQLSQVVADKTKMASQRWAADLEDAIRDSIGFLKRAAMQCDPADPDAVHSVAGSLKILTDVATAQRILDARFAQEDRGDRAPGGSLVGEEEPQRAAYDAE